MRILKTESHDLKSRVLEYAARVVRLCCALPKTDEAQIIKKQLFRSGTSVGAHVAEANRGKSRADFISKLEGGLQELEEARYRMELLIVLEVVPSARLEPLLKETDEITSILVAMVSRSRRNQ